MIPCDIVFIFDTSDSMSDKIVKVKEIVNSFTKDLQSKDVDYRLGMVEFEAVNRIKAHDFTDDADEFIKDVNNVLNTSGGYEYGLTAIQTALSMNFRDDAQKFFIMLTDEGYEESRNVLNPDDIKSALKNKNVRLDVIGLVDGENRSGGCQSEYTPIARYTGGRFYDINGNIPTIFRNITGEINIPGDAFVYNGHSYYLYSNVADTWEEAEKYCEALGGHLAVIDNAAENTALFEALKGIGISNAYFGLTDVDNEGTWKWITGSTSSYRNWGEGEPNSESNNDQHFGENYAEFYYKYSNGEWNDGNFNHGTINDSANFICEWDTTETMNGVDTDTVSSETSFISYNDLTPEQLQQLSESSIKSLIALINAYEEEDIEPATFEECDNDPSIFEQSKKWTKLTHYLAKIRKQAKSESNIDIPFSMIADLNEILVDVEKINDSSKSEAEKNSAKLDIGSKCFSIADAVSEWKALDTLKSTSVGGVVLGGLFPVVSAIFGLASNYVATQDGMDTEKRQELEKSFVELSGATISAAGKAIGKNVTEGIVKVATDRILSASIEEFLTRELIADGVEEAVKNSLTGKFNSAIRSSILSSVKEATQEAMQKNYNQILAGAFDTIYADAVKEEVTKALTAKVDKIFSPFGPVNAGIAIVTGVVAGVDQYNASKAQYTEDQIPNATRDALLDAAATGIYEAIHKYTFGADDALVQLGAWFGSLVTGREFFDIDDYADNWVELIARDIKYRFLNEFVGTDKGDALMSVKDGEMLYGGYGNDSITNFHSNMTIYGGADCDTVISIASNYRSDYGGTAPTGTTHNNYIDLGLGNDSLAMHDYNSTVYGGGGSDTLIVVGDDPESPTYGNKIYGEVGNDNIQVTNVDNSSINGGSGNDYILLRKVTHSTVHGGTGNDYIELDVLSNNNVIDFGRNNGNDVVVGYNASDTIQFSRIINGQTYSTVANGNDVIICLGDDSITLKDANSQQLHIKANYLPSQEDLTMKSLIDQKQKIMGDLSVVRSVRGDLRLRASEGEVSVEDIRDNLISVTDDNDNITAQVYVARAEGGEIAGNALGDSPNIFKVIVGASENRNQIIAGDGGSSLFGGLTDDILHGGISRDAFSYSSGNDTINAYETWEDVTFDGTYQNWVVTGDDFVINAAEGSLRVKDARDKLLEFKNPDGSVLAHVCMPSDDATFDGSTYNEFVVAVGANNYNNILIAGNAGSSLWGGNGDNSDNLFGGAGADAFIYHYGNGEDNIFNASSEDIVLLPDITLNEIHSVFENQNKVDIGFTDGGALNIDGKVSSYILRSNEYPAKPTPFSIEQLKRGVMEK